MNVQMIFFIFALFLAPQQPMRGSIEGRVLNALNGQPLAGAQVSAVPGPAGLSDVVAGRLSAGAINSIPPQGATVIRSTSSAGTTPSSGPTITTGNDGKFFFTDLGPGTYRVTVSANGYAAQQYGQLGPNLSGRPITITAAGEQINNGGNGSFAITGITPGDYALFAWEAMEPNSYRDPDVLRQYESKGRSVRIAEASNQTIELRVIPAQ